MRAKFIGKSDNKLYEMSRAATNTLQSFSNALIKAYDSLEDLEFHLDVDDIKDDFKEIINKTKLIWSHES